MIRIEIQIFYFSKNSVKKMNLVFFSHGYIILCQRLKFKFEPSRPVFDRIWRIEIKFRI